MHLSGEGLEPRLAMIALGMHVALFVCYERWYSHWQGESDDCINRLCSDMGILAG